MTRRLLFVLLLTLALPIHAEYYYRYIGYSCDVKKDKLIINYTTIPYEGDYKPTKKKHRWELGALIETKEGDKAHTFISKITKIVRHCKLRNGTYKITISPAPGNHDLEGQCGAHMSAWAEVTLEGKVVLPSYNFDEYCTNPDSPITTQIIFKSGAASPLFKTIPR